MKKRGKNILATILTIVVALCFFSLNRAPASTGPVGMIAFLLAAIVFWLIARLILAILVRSK